MEKKSFIFMIGSRDNGFNTEDDLLELDGEGVSCYVFDISTASVLEGHTLEEMALIIGFGLAFKHDWCKDGTVWHLREI